MLININLQEESNILKILDRDKNVFITDLIKVDKQIKEEIQNSSFLVIGGAGSIGSQVTKQIFKLNPKKLHVIDISENELAELVRDLRSSIGYIKGEFKTFTIDANSKTYNKLVDSNKYDYILNFSAMKHLRTERDIFSLIRMLETNIFLVEKTIKLSIEKGTKKYFCVSTDKAVNPTNLMGASKKIMEEILKSYMDRIAVSSARFANVIFSNGSITYSFLKRIEKNQPITAPNDIKRYFITPYESAILCIISAIIGKNEIFIPKLNHHHLKTPWQIAKNLLKLLDIEPHICNTEEEARKSVGINKKKWPCFISETDTTGEKNIEEFYYKNEKITNNIFKDISVIKMDSTNGEIDYFIKSLKKSISSNNLTKAKIVKLFEDFIPGFKHMETNKYLDDKM
ncbi:MAG: polysaccharide biosynthesis protein [Candidatus Calescibacterium sp.]|nr:polysaccharide biosynthesis protein [Candidatus Calescibacterium sp.]MDW8132992.1 polysaccharide biosynthesis protein [Candidatus Calescibacterium sp.]